MTSIRIEDKHVYSATDIALFLGFSRRHVSRLCKSAKIRSVQIGGRLGKYRIIGENLKKFLMKSIIKKQVHYKTPLTL